MANFSQNKQVKASFEALQLMKGQSFIIRRFDEKVFSAPFHFHPELELTLILKGEGRRYIGSNMSSYIPGDLVLLGPNLPHCWKSENVKKGKLNATSIVIQFMPDFMGPGFTTKPELRAIRQLLERSSSGIHFTEGTAMQAQDAILQLLAQTNTFQRLIGFLEILYLLAGSREYALLDKQQASFTHSPAEQKRIHAVMAYIVDRFRKEITLEEVATVAGMTPTAFCKFFKKATRKTLMETVMDYRINYAAQQLVHTDKPVADIGFESGFGDVSHFYKTFRQKKECSPLQYRNQFVIDA
jgi:AraC-like DNA-binding protein/mannose-6-phosphate isomerase-like protein (cupin superfamily)